MGNVATPTEFEEAIERAMSVKSLTDMLEIRVLAKLADLSGLIHSQVQFQRERLLDGQIPIARH